MRVGVVSDSHGETENLKRAASLLVENQKVEVIAHLGDDYSDTSVLEELGVRIVKVPGVYSSYYQDRDILNRVVETFNGRKVLITHTECCHENDLPQDIKPEELAIRKAVDVVLCGHSHIPRIEEKQGVLYINPGHLKTQDKKGFPPSFAVVDFKDKINVFIFNLQGKILQSETF